MCNIEKLKKKIVSLEILNVKKKFKRIYNSIRKSIYKKNTGAESLSHVKKKKIPRQVMITFETFFYQRVTLFRDFRFCKITKKSRWKVQSYELKLNSSTNWCHQTQRFIKCCENLTKKRNHFKYTYIFKSRHFFNINRKNCHRFSSYNITDFWTLWINKLANILWFKSS